MAQLARVARSLPVLFPLHPRTRKMLGRTDRDGSVRLVDPMGYFDFLSLESDAAAVLTDSGGIQEETTCLGIPCFTLRDNTERPVTIRKGTNTLLGLAPARIAEIPERIVKTDRTQGQQPPFWDGHAAKRVAEVIATDDTLTRDRVTNAQVDALRSHTPGFQNRSFVR
jgi:UDP-N-acetylglucosamine 2-epimerase (non-hydrolysing)